MYLSIQSNHPLMVKHFGHTFRPHNHPIVPVLHPRHIKKQPIIWQHIPCQSIECQGTRAIFWQDINWLALNDHLFYGLDRGRSIGRSIWQLIEWFVDCFVSCCIIRHPTTHQKQPCVICVVFRHRVLDRRVLECHAIN